MKITAIRATPLTATWEAIFGPNVPRALRHPAAHFQSFARRGQYATIVEIEVEDGLTGRGEAWGLPVPQMSAALINDYFAPALMGRDALDSEAIWHDVHKMGASLGYAGGVWMEALSGLDMALWDWRGQRENYSVSELLGRRRHRVEIYASPVPFCDTPQQAADKAREFASQGFKALKVKAGRTVSTDVAHLRAIRAAIGSDVKLLVDFNCAYDAAQTVAFAREASDLDLYWLEEPLPPHELEELSRVRRQMGIPIAAGENAFSPFDFSQLITRGQVDVLTPNVTRAGGITGVLKIAAVAEKYGVRLALHGVGGALMLHASLHLMGALPQVDLFECNRLPNPLRDELAPLPALENGALLVPQGAGLGCALDPEIVRRFSP